MRRHRPSSVAPATIDLTGRHDAWPARARRLWAGCLEDALADADAWRTAPRSGDPSLRRALGERLDVDPAALLITCGVRASVRSLLAGAARLVIEAPTYGDVPAVARDHGVVVHPMSIDDVLEAPAPGDAVLWITQPARNPDGRTLSAEQTARLSDLSGRYLRVVTNEAYRWCRPDAARVVGGVTVGTLHKLTGGGMRVGWLHSDGTDAPAAPDGTPPRPWQLALTRFVDAGGLDVLVEHSLTAAQARSARFLDLCREYGLTEHLTLAGGDGPSVLVSFSERLEDDVLRRLGAAGLTASPGSAFLAPSGSVRLCFTGVDDDVIPLCVDRLHRVAIDLQRPNERGAHGN